MSSKVTQVINTAKFLGIEELNLRAIHLLLGHLSEILKIVKATSIWYIFKEITILNLDSGQLLEAVKTKQSCILKPNYNNLQVLCLCNNINDDITCKTRKR